MLKIWLNKYFGKLAATVLVVALFSCATVGSKRISALNQPLNTLQKVALISLPVGKLKVSSNAREYNSQFFIPDGNNVRFWIGPKSTDNIRYQALIKVLGDRRPYEVEVIVTKQKLVKSWSSTRPRFEVVGYSESIAEIVAKYYSDNLTKALKDRNFIDDFRVF